MALTFHGLIMPSLLLSKKESAFLTSSGLPFFPFAISSMTARQLVFV